MAPSPNNPGEGIGEASAHQPQSPAMQGAVWPIINNPSRMVITIDDDESDQGHGNPSPVANMNAIPAAQGHQMDINYKDPVGDNDDEELFVQQDSFIDLTIEDEQDAEDRRRRIANIMVMSGPDDPDAPAIKEEDQQFMIVSIPRANATAGAQSLNSSQSPSTARSPSTAQPLEDLNFHEYGREWQDNHSQDDGHLQGNGYPEGEYNDPESSDGYLESGDESVNGDENPAGEDDYPEGYDHVLDIDQPLVNDQASDNGGEEVQPSSKDSGPDTSDQGFKRMQLLMTNCRRLHRQRGEAGLTKRDKFDLATWNSEIDDLKEQLGVGDEDNIQGDSGALDNAEEGLGSLPEHRAVAPPVSSTGGNMDSQRPKPRVKPTKTAREYWERQYATIAAQGSAALNQNGKRPANSNPTGERAAKKPNGRGGRSQKKNPANAAFEKAKFSQMLRAGNPFMARAAIGEVALPQAIQSTTKGHQWQQILSNLTNGAPKRSIRVDKKILEEATKSFGFGKCQARDGRWLLPGMKTTLFHHQLVGVRWMMGQEYSPEEPHGGILADEMGLGKTLEILAAMATNRPSKEDILAGRRTTLIVTPASSIAQWTSEINRHCSWVEKVLHYKQSTSLQSAIWRDTDIM